MSEKPNLQKKVWENLWHGLLITKTLIYVRSSLEEKCLEDYLDKLNEVASANLAKYESHLTGRSTMMNISPSAWGLSQSEFNYIQLQASFHRLKRIQSEIFKNTMNEEGLALMEIPNIEEFVELFEEFKVKYEKFLNRKE